MNKRDLKHGNVVETREGFRYLYINDKSNCNVDWLVNLDKKDCDMKNIYNYRDDLTYNHMALHHLDIVRVYKDYTCKELLWERKEPIKLSDDEITILRNIDEEFKYIVRDGNGLLYIYKNKPDKTYDSCWGNGRGTCFGFKHLFQFIQWEDEEPYLIEDLLKEESENG